MRLSGGSYDFATLIMPTVQQPNTVSQACFVITVMFSVKEDPPGQRNIVSGSLTFANLSTVLSKQLLPLNWNTSNILNPKHEPSMQNSNSLAVPNPTDNHVKPCVVSEESRSSRL
jgi:hypothetical protein